MLNVKIKKLDVNAKMPTYAHGGDACFDLYCTYGGVVPAHDSFLLTTGLAVEIPPLHVLRIFSRSGHGYKNGIRLSNIVGILDANYRGEVFIKLHNDSDTDYYVDPGERVAQGCIDIVHPVKFQFAEQLSETERGTAGLGSSGRL